MITSSSASSRPGAEEINRIRNPLGDDSPGEFEPHVVATLQNMCQSFEIQATRLRLDLIRFAMIRLRMR